MNLRNEDDYQRKIKAILAQRNTGTNLLKVKAQNTEADVKINYQEELEDKRDI